MCDIKQKSFGIKRFYNLRCRLAIKKKDFSKVKLLVRDIENTTIESRSLKVRNVRKRQKKLEVSEKGASLTQPKLENFFSKEKTRQSTLTED